MKKFMFGLFSKSNQENAKSARPSKLCLENLEARQLLSVTDVAALAGLESAETVQVAEVAPVADLAINLDSVADAEEGAVVTLSSATPTFGERLSASVAEGSATYVWYCGTSEESMVEIGTDSSVYPTQSQIGCYFKVVATFTDGPFAGETATATTEDALTRPLQKVWLNKSMNLSSGMTLQARLVKDASADVQWYRGVDVEGSEWTAIEGATGSTYTITDADCACYLKAVATGTNGYVGSVEVVTMEAVKGEQLLLSTDQPCIKTYVTATLVPEGAATYQWYTVDSEGVEAEIADATKASLWVTSAQMGCKLKVVATYTDGVFVGQTFTKTTSNVVGIAVSAIKISTPVPYVGKELVAYTTPVAATTDIQWYRVDAEGNETAIEGATGKRYTIVAEDAGCYLKVEAIGTGDYVGTVSVTTPVVVEEEVPISLSTYNPIWGERIIAKLNPADSFASYQWYFANEDGLWESIDGATFNYFSPNVNYIGKELRVVATYQKGDYAGLTASANTDIVTRRLGDVTVSVDGVLNVGSEVVSQLAPKGATAEYQWYRVDAQGVATEIEGATDANYVATTDDAGCYLKVVATGTENFSGTCEAVTDTVVAGCFVTLSGDPALGGHVVATLSTDDPTATYQWFAVSASGKETELVNYTGNYVDLSYNQVNCAVKVVVTINSGAYAGEVVEAQSETVTRKVGQVVITSDVIGVGSTVKTYITPTASKASYQWYRVDAAGGEELIEGATGKTYVASSEDVGYQLKIVATGVGYYLGTSEAISSVVLAANVDVDVDDVDEDLVDLLGRTIL